MNRKILAISIYVQVLVILIAPSDVCFAKIVQRCHMCGMDAAKSQTEFIVYLNNGKQEHTCCLHCVYLLENFFMQDEKISKIETRDFSTGKIIDAKLAYYLEGSTIIPKGSMAPFFLAFSEKETADRYANKYKGAIKTFKEAMEIAAKFDQEVRVK